MFALGVELSRDRNNVRRDRRKFAYLTPVDNKDLVKKVFVQAVWVHGFIYAIKDGIIRDLNISVEAEAQLVSLRNSFLEGQPPVRLLGAS
jgi:hypothetical protein